MSRLPVAAALAVAILLVPLSMTSRARADVVVMIDKASQTMSVAVDGEQRYSWPVSTGAFGGGTPSGTFRPQSLKRHHWSSRYNNAPMPYSIFYDGNYAIHGTTHVRQLGGRASRGCIRLHPKNAAVLFSLVRDEGMDSTRIVVR